MQFSFKRVAVLKSIDYLKNDCVFVSECAVTD